MEPNDPRPPVSGVRAPDDQETELGSDDRARAANDALRALARAARSFQLYDPSNDAIRTFLEEVRDAFHAFGAHHGELHLAVRPFEMVLAPEREVVYLERDRERSLAFRLFRDGVRNLVVQPAVAWSELLQLLEILSIRYTGLSHSEDDVVTLLWKANFQNIDVEAVEGFVPEDEVEDDGLGLELAHQRLANHAEVRVPPNFDLPHPNLTGEDQPTWRPIADATLDRLRSEETSQHLPEDCLGLVSELLTVVQDPTDPVRLSEARPLLTEIRDFLLSEGQLDNLLRMLDLLLMAVRGDQDGADVQVLIDSFADRNALARLVHSVPPDADTVPESFLRLLDQLPGDHLSTLIDLLETERAARSRRTIRQLIARELPARSAYVIQRLQTSYGSVAADLFRAVTAGSPDDAQKLALELSNSGDMDILFECCHVVELTGYNATTRAVAFKLLHSHEEMVRIRTIQGVGHQGDRRMFPALVRHAKERSGGRLGDDEAKVIGGVMARLDPEAALAAFKDWCLPKGLLSRVRGADHALNWAAVTGLPLVDNDDADGVLKQIAHLNREDEALYNGAVQGRVRRRQRIAEDQKSKAGA